MVTAATNSNAVLSTAALWTRKVHTNPCIFHHSNIAVISRGRILADCVGEKVSIKNCS